MFVSLFTVRVYVSSPEYISRDKIFGVRKFFCSLDALHCSIIKCMIITAKGTFLMKFYYFNGKSRLKHSRPKNPTTAIVLRNPSLGNGLPTLRDLKAS